MTGDLQLVLVRHGETEWTERGLLHSRLDSPLSARGRRHAELTARWLSGDRFHGFYSSPQGRAMETASILSGAIGLAPQPLAGLRERNFGWVEGWRTDNVEDGGRGRWQPIGSLVWRLTRERPRQVARRLDITLHQMAGQHARGRILVVTHYNTLSVLMANLLNGRPEDWQRYGPWKACGISELHLVNRAWRPVRLNEHSHLRETPT